MIERGLLRQAVYFQSGREEHFSLVGLPASIAQSYHSRWDMTDLTVDTHGSEAISFELSQWDFTSGLWILIGLAYGCSI